MQITEKKDILIAMNFLLGKCISTKIYHFFYKNINKFTPMRGEHYVNLDTSPKKIHVLIGLKSYFYKAMETLNGVNC